MPDFDETNVNDLASNLLADTRRDLDYFSENFSEKGLEFLEALARAFKKFQLYVQLFDSEVDEHTKYTAQSIYMTIDALHTSVRLIGLGFFEASGNTFRQSLEALALSILCSHKGDLQRWEKRKGKKKAQLVSFDFLHDYKAQKDHAKVHKAIPLLKINSGLLGTKLETIEIHEKMKGYYNQFSHPTLHSFNFRLNSSNKEPKLLLGSTIEHINQSIIHLDLQKRIEYCKLIPDVIDGTLASLNK